MILADDLVAGLVALADADASNLGEPERGYCLSGFSFSPAELFDELKRLRPTFAYDVALDADAAKFAALWPDSISPDAARADLGFKAACGFQDTVKHILAAHIARAMRMPPPPIVESGPGSEERPASNY